jgi:toxin ParE1/3/4
MGIVLRTPASQHDYAEIWAYIAEHNIVAADKLLRKLDETVLFLSQFPRAGPARPELRPGVRSFPVGQYVIFYRPVTDGIELLRVLHGKRNLRRILNEQHGN